MTKIEMDSLLLCEIRVVIFSLYENRLQSLLSKSIEPLGSGQWEIPGSPIKPDLSLEETASTALTRLTNIQEPYLEQLFTYGETNRHPEKQLISVVYFALIPTDSHQNTILIDQDIKWSPVSSLPMLVADHHQILQYAVRRLRYKLEYSAVGFELLPDTFTLSELQQTYEIILEETLDKRNFRRRILQAGIIEPTPHQKGGEGRPARLYRYRPDAIAEVKARRLFP